MKRSQKWRRVVQLVNSSDDEELAARLRVMMLHNFAIPITIGNRPVGEDPSLAKRARELLPELRILLRGLAEGATRAQRSVAMRVLQSHKGHLESDWERTPKDLVGKKAFLDLRTGKIRWIERSEKYQVSKYRDPLDPIINEMIPQPPVRGCVPVRVCSFASCKKFFVRSGRRLYCPTRCKAARWRPKFQMSPGERRDYQVKYRAERLLKERGPEALRRWIQKLARRRMTPARRRWMMATLRGALR